MAINKCKAMRDSGKLTKHFCRIGAVTAVLLLLLVVVAGSHEKTNQTIPARNQTENQANDIKSQSVILDTFYYIAKGIRTRYKEIIIAAIAKIFFVYYICKCVVPRSQRTDTYTQVDCV